MKARSGEAVRRSPAGQGIALVVSDVDGTLVTTDKRLTRRSVAAVERLDAAGIAFTIASSRPPIGLRGLVEHLRLRLPMAAFNGSTIVGPDLRPLAETLIPPDAAREAAQRLDAAGIDVWVFAHGRWNLRDPRAPYTDLERRTLGVEPDVATDLAPLLDAAAKIVGVSADAALLERAEAELAGALDGRAGVHRSQAYYLDVTAPGADKGRFVTDTAARLGIGPERVATIGDAANDVAMFRASGLSFAMGNAPPEVKRASGAVTAGNDEDGFAQAMERILARR